MRSAVVLLILSVFASGCSLVDIRPEGWEQAFGDDAAESRGAAILDEMAEAHGGRDAFVAHQTAALELTDTFPNPLIRTFTSPWPQDPVRVRQELLIPGENSRLEFLEGPTKGDVWGIQNWATYRQLAGRDLEFVDDANIKFWLPTLGYFFQMPFRLQEAGIKRDLGAVEVQGRSYQRVFLSWGTHEPQAHVDQYIAYVDAETKRLTWVEYTVRDMGGFVRGTMHFRDYEQVQGIWVAKTMAVVDGPGGADNLHRINLLDVKFGEPIETSRIIPRPDVSGGK